jgi:hypothetical protein
MPLLTTGAGKYPVAAGGGAGSAVLLHTTYVTILTGTSPATIATSLDIPANANRALVIGFGFTNSNAGTNTVTAVSYDGAPMTYIGGPYSNGVVGDCYLYGMINPNVGNGLVISFSWTGGGSDRIAVGALSLYNVDQTSPFHGATSSTGSTSPAQTNVASFADEYTLGVFMIGSNVTTAVHNTIGGDAAGAINCVAAEYNVATGTSTNVGYGVGSGAWIAAGVSVKGV